MDEVEEFPAWRFAYECFKKEGKKPGDVLTRDWFAERLHLPLGNDSQATHAQFIVQFKAFELELLYEDKIHLEGLGGYECRVLYASEQTDVAVQQAFKLVKKGLRRATRRLMNPDLERMTDAEKAKNNDRLARVGASLGFFVERLTGADVARRAPKQLKKPKRTQD